MKKITLVLCTLLTVLSNAVADNLTASTLVIASGEQAELVIGLENNDHSYTAFNFTLTLPEGLTMTGVQKSDRMSDHGVSYKYLGDGSYEIVCLSNTSAEITGKNGTLLSLQIQADASFTSKNELGKIQSISFTTTKNAVEIHIANIDILINPSYTVLAYIESTGASRENAFTLPYTPVTATQIDAKFQVYDSSNGWCGIFSARNTHAGTGISLYMNGDRAHFGYFTGGTTGAGDNFAPFSLNTDYEVQADVTKLVVNGETYETGNTTTNATTRKLSLFANPEWDNPMRGRFYYCTISEDGETIYDFKPVMRHDGVIGFYDKASKVFVLPAKGTFEGYGFKTLDNQAYVTFSKETRLVIVGSPAQFLPEVQNINNATFTWTSSDESIATVAADGTVTGVKAGKVMITAITDADYGWTASYELTVSQGLDINVSSLSRDGYTVDDDNPLITDAWEQLYGKEGELNPCTDLGEGSEWALLGESIPDEITNRNTQDFWHSNWHNGDQPAGSHYLQVMMTDDLDPSTLIAFVFKRRPADNDQTIEWCVKGTDDPNATKEECEELAYVETPFANNTEVLMSTVFERSSYKYLRFYSEKQYGSGYGSRGYFHMARFNIFTVEKIEVTDAVTITADNQIREYGEVNPELTYMTQGASLEGTPTISCEATATSPVGEYPIVITKGSVTNDNDSYVNGTLKVTKAPLTVGLAETYSCEEGEPIPNFELTYSGWKLNETEEVLTEKPTATTTATVESRAGTYPISISGGSAQNYELNYVPGTLTITALPLSMLGDVNRDGKVSVGDVVLTANHLLGHTPKMPFNVRLADADNDGQVDVADLVEEVNKIADQMKANTSFVKGQWTEQDEELTGYLYNGQMSILLANEIPYTAFQMTLTVPEGTNMDEVTATLSRATNHQIGIGRLNERQLRIIAYSFDNQTFTDNAGPIFKMKGIEGDILVDDILFITPDGQKHRFTPIRISPVTGIADMFKGRKESEKPVSSVYDITGRPMPSKVTKSGLYINKGKKMMIR